MRYTRYEFTKNKRKWIKIVVWVFAIIIIYTALIKVIISNFIIVPSMPVISSTNDNGGDKYEYKKAEPSKYYIIQLGAFSSQSNAESFANELRSNNIPIYIYKEEKLSAAITFVSSDKENSLKKAEEFKQAGYVTIIKEITISPEDMTGEMRSKDSYLLINKIINNTSDILKTTIKSFEAQGASGEGFKNINGLLKGLCNDISENTKLIENSNPVVDDHLLDVLNNFEGSMASIMKSVTVDDENQAYTIITEQGVLELIYAFRDFVKEVNVCIGISAQ